MDKMYFSQIQLTQNTKCNIPTTGLIIDAGCMNQNSKNFWEGCLGGLLQTSARGKEGWQVTGIQWALRAARLCCQGGTTTAVREELSRAELPPSTLAAHVHLHAWGQATAGSTASGPQMGSTLQQGASTLSCRITPNLKHKAIFSKMKIILT